jgi:hypothetical protein
MRTRSKGGQIEIHVGVDNANLAGQDLEKPAARLNSAKERRAKRPFSSLSETFRMNRKFTSSPDRSDRFFALSENHPHALMSGNRLHRKMTLTICRAHRIGYGRRSGQSNKRQQPSVKCRQVGRNYRDEKQARGEADSKHE